MKIRSLLNEAKLKKSEQDPPDPIYFYFYENLHNTSVGTKGSTRTGAKMDKCYKKDFFKTLPVTI